MNKLHNIVLLLVFIFFVSCIQDQSAKKNRKQKKGVGIEIKYAKGFTITRFDGYKKIVVANPWQHAKDISYNYIIYEDKNVLPDNLKADAFIQVPVKRVVCLSLTHISLIDLIEETHTIVGVSGKHFVSNMHLKEQINKGIIKDVGNDQHLNYEMLISLKPDLVVAYGVTAKATNYINKLRELDIPAVINAEYLESSPLGKAEWVKFMAAFYNKEKLADKKFRMIERNYNELVAKTDNINEKPIVLSSLPWKDTWYIPGGNSYFAQLIRDAGGEYIWHKDNSNESIPLSIEEVIAKANKADIWINTGTAKTRKDIIDKDVRLKKVKAFKNGMVFNNNLRQNDAGGNAFWETGVVNPHILLKDLIEIFHPGLIDHKLYYYHQLKSK